MFSYLHPLFCFDFLLFFPLPICAGGGTPHPLSQLDDVSGCRRLEEALKMLLAMKEAGLKPDEARAKRVECFRDLVSSWVCCFLLFWGEGWKGKERKVASLEDRFLKGCLYSRLLSTSRFALMFGFLTGGLQ